MGELAEFTCQTWQVIFVAVWHDAPDATGGDGRIDDPETFHPAA